MVFDYLACTRPTSGGADRRARAAAQELATRAALLFRLGFSQKAAVARLVARVAWEYDPPSTGKRGAHHRPDALSDAGIAKIVADTYARKPSLGA
jgi:hypothetical protein|nr:hypothetical protein [Kofleriaceae bacterium]